MEKEVLIQTLKQVKYKYLLVHLKTKNKKNQKRKIKQNKRTRRKKRRKSKRTSGRNKNFMTLINKSMCISCQKIFYQITKNEKYTIKIKTTEIWRRTWNKLLFRV